MTSPVPVVDEAHISAFADDDVVEDADAHEFANVAQASSDLDVLLGRRWVAGRQKRTGIDCERDTKVKKRKGAAARVSLGQLQSVDVSLRLSGRYRGRLKFLFAERTQTGSRSNSSAEFWWGHP